MKTPVTSGSVRHHIRYSWWKYLMAAVLAFTLVDLIYSVTAYRSPRDKVVQFYVYGYMNEQGLTAYLDNVRETEMSDMEVVGPQTMLDDETYGPMQLMTYFAAGEGDIYLLPRENFLSYAEEGCFLPLEEDTELMALFDAAGVSLQSGWRRQSDTGETHLYGIPQDKLPGLSQYAYARDGYLCISITSGNQENAAKLFRILCRDLISGPEPSEPAAE